MLNGNEKNPQKMNIWDDASLTQRCTSKLGE